MEHESNDYTICALGTVTKGLVQELEDYEKKGMGGGLK